MRSCIKLMNIKNTLPRRLALSKIRKQILVLKYTVNKVNTLEIMGNRADNMKWGKLMYSKGRYIEVI